MSRKKAREIAVHMLFAQTFYKEDCINELISQFLDAEIRALLADEVAIYAGQPTPAQMDYIRTVTHGVMENKAALDKQIGQNLHGWSVARLSRITMSVLRLAIYEMESVTDVPTGVAINEAIDLVKLYDGEEAGAFVNGVLGAITRGDNAEAIAAAEAAEAEAARLAAEQQAQAQAELDAILLAEVGEVADTDTQALHDVLHPVAPVVEQVEAAPVYDMDDAETVEAAPVYDMDDDEPVEPAPEA